jgi:photosystem II stability/assembly factor-like uncharacterized protein
MYAERVVLALALSIGLSRGDLQSQSPSLAERQREAAAAKAGWRASLSTAEIKKFDGGDVHSVHFFTRHVGWAVGRGTATMLLKTVDGGKTWERFPLMDGASHGSIFNAIRFWDVNHGWITGRHGLLRTTDGGESWEPVTGATYHDASVLLPLSPEVVMIGAYNGQIWLTSPDGTNASQIGTIEGSNVSGLAFVAPNTFYATQGAVHGNAGAIHRSVDGGATWEPVIRGDRPILGISFRDTKRGVAVGEGVAYYTNDGGDTWKRVIASGTRYTAAYIDDNTIVSPGKTPGIAISRDGGKTWRPFSSPPTTYNLVDIAAVDGGWWFVAGGYGATAIYQYIDPDFVDEIAQGSIPVPATIKLPGGRRLPSGMYDVTLTHRGERHVITLERTGEAPVDSSGATQGEPTTDTATATPEKPPTCDPCEATVPVEVEYEVEELTPETKNRSRLRFSLEPTGSGVAIVIDAAISPPRDAAIALAALGLKEEQEVDAGTTVRKAGAATKKAVSWKDRLKKAADGDLRGAAAEVAVNPQAAVSRVKAAKAAPPAMFRIKVRYPIEIFRRTAAPAPDGGESR